MAATANAYRTGGRQGRGEIELISPYPGADVIKQLRAMPGAKWHGDRKAWTFDCNASTARLIDSLISGLETNVEFGRLLSLGAKQ